MGVGPAAAQTSFRLVDEGRRNYGYRVEVTVRQTDSSNTIGVVGAGSWGTALAVHLSAAGRSVTLWGRSADLISEIRSSGRNERYLPSVAVGEEIELTSDPADLEGCELLLVVVPSHGFRSVLGELLSARDRQRPTTVVSATKGIETESLRRMSAVTAEEFERWGGPGRFAVLSGPSFAAELAAGAPTAAVIAAETEELAIGLRERLSTPRFRLYSSTDVTGVEIGGTAKNVIAIAAGVVAGLRLGHNTLAALITRGLHEITRLGVASGGTTQTFAGLAGLGDLVLTCTGGLSRNRSTGVALAEGRTMAEIGSGSTMVAEGVRNSIAVHRLAEKVGIEMPITAEMVAILYEGRDPRRALEALMQRDLKAESKL